MKWPMKWPWRRKHDQHAQEAIAAAQERLDAVEAVEPAVSLLSHQLERLGKENRFGPRFRAAFKGHQ